VVGFASGTGAGFASGVVPVTGAGIASGIGASVAPGITGGTNTVMASSPCRVACSRGGGSTSAVPAISGSMVGGGFSVGVGVGVGAATAAGEGSAAGWFDVGAGISGSASRWTGAGVGAGATVGLGAFRCFIDPTAFAGAVGDVVAGANGHPVIRPGRAGCVVTRCEPAPADGPTVFDVRLAPAAIVPAGSAGAAAAVNSKTASGVVANNRQRPTLRIPGSPWCSRDFRTRSKPDKRVRIPERVRRRIKILRMLQKGNETQRRG